MNLKQRLGLALLVIAPLFTLNLPSAIADTVYKNANWTITVGNEQSWSGVNGTGDLTYRGCDTRNRCLSLRGGTVTCRDGICTMAWRNGDYAYLLRSPMQEEPANNSQMTLIVRQGAKTILETTGFQVVR